MRTVTLNEYIDVVGTIPSANYRPLNDTSNISILNDILSMLYGRLSILDALTSDMVSNNIKLIFAINEYKYTKLYETTQADFDILENVNASETETTTHTSSIKDTENIGARKAEERSTNDSTADITNTGSTTASGGETNIHSVAAYDSTDKFADETKDAHTMDSRKDTTESMSKNTVSASGGTETTEDARTNTNEHTESTSTTRSLTRHGNIGVTSSTQLLQGVRDLANFSFYRVVAQDIIAQICIGVY